MVIPGMGGRAAGLLTGALLLLGALSPGRGAAAPAPRADARFFFPGELVSRLRRNVEADDRVAEAARAAAREARHWADMPDEDLWRLVFGPTLPRSWMVWSDGHCPACEEPVPMYNWLIDALERPWKVACPHCREEFPKNDFKRFYVSGLDDRGVFDPALADRSLLYNREHPDPGDPRHTFGVDDGHGFADSAGRRWRFIGAYLVYGQWKQAVLGGINALSRAYLFTGEPLYARKTAILLDRLADLYPGFDFAAQGYIYERQDARAYHGYIEVWHDAVHSARQLALAWDIVRETARDDEALTTFLAGKSARHGLENPKATFADIERNINERIFRHTLDNSHRIASNHPNTPITRITLQAVLGWPEAEIEAAVDAMITRVTGVDGLSGEKGLAGYSFFVPQELARFLALFERARPGFLARRLAKHPALRQTWRFHIDTWCLGHYYPQVGDAGAIGLIHPRYLGVPFPPAGEEISSRQALEPSMFTFLWELHAATGDVAFVQVLHHANGGRVEGLPHDIFRTDSARVRHAIEALIAAHGPEPRPGSVNKEAWRLAIMRSGEGRRARAAWLNYESGSTVGHGHLDALNLGLFAHGLDLMPDFGYPPVQFGGWTAPQARWYISSAAHNTAVVDGQDHRPAQGRTEAWAGGAGFQVIRAAVPGAIGDAGTGQRFERTVAMIDMPDPDGFYLLDIFRLAGGREHKLFMHSGFSRVSSAGLTLEPDEEGLPGATMMRDFHRDSNPAPGWHVDWQLEDRHGRGPAGADVHLRYTSLTAGAEALLASGWVSSSWLDAGREEWNPRLLVRRQAGENEEALASTFAGVIEAYAGRPRLAAARRLPLADHRGRPLPDGFVAMEITHADGTRDLLLAADTGHPAGPSGSAPRLVQEEWQAELAGEMLFARRDGSGRVTRIAAVNAAAVRVGEKRLDNPDPPVFIEWTAGD